MGLFPCSMRKVSVPDLSSVKFSWKMMTCARPESQLDEELFTRLVELDGLRRRSRMRENQTYMKRSDPDRVLKLPSESKGGMLQINYKVCDECLDEFCDGICAKMSFEDFKRTKDLFRSE